MMIRIIVLTLLGCNDTATVPDATTVDVRAVCRYFDLCDPVANPECQPILICCDEPENAETVYCESDAGTP